MKSSRRSFIAWAAGCLSLLLVPRRSLARKLALPLGKIKKLAKPGGSALLKVKGRHVLLIRQDEKTIHALDPHCTHRKCIVSFDAAKKKIECPCHRSEFGVDGSLLKGPAPKPLRRYPAEIDGERIIIEIP